MGKKSATKVASSPTSEKEVPADGTEKAKATGALARRPAIIPQRHKKAPVFTDELTEAQQISMAQSFMAQRRAKGAYKPRRFTADDVKGGARAALDITRGKRGGKLGKIAAKGIAKGVDEVAGANVVAHGQSALLAAQIAAAAAARRDPIKKARTEMARVDNRLASRELHASVQDFKDNTGAGFLSKAPARGPERKAAVQALMDTHGKEEFNRRYRASKGNQAIFAAMKKVAANKRLLDRDREMGNKVLPAWTQEQTVGTAVPEHMKDTLTPGHTIAASDVVAASTKGNVLRGLESLSPTSDRPMGNTAKLSDEQKMRLDMYQGMRDALEQKAKDDKADRAELKKAKPDQRGYTDEEFAERAKLKDQLSDLDTTRKADRSQRSGNDLIGYGHTTAEQDKLATGKRFIDRTTKERRAEEIAKHQGTYDTLHAKTTGSFMRNFLSGSLPPELQKELTDSEAQLKAISDRGPAATTDDQVTAESLKARIAELQEQKASGLSAEEYAQKKQAKGEIERLKKADASELPFTEAEQAGMDLHKTTAEDIEFQRTHGLDREKQAEYEAATAARTSQKETRDTGLTDDERKLMAFLDAQIAGVYDEAKTGRAFVSEHEGETVSLLGRVGGLDSSDSVDPKAMEVTKAGRAAQMARTVGGGIGATGDALNASTSSIQKAIDNGELLKASANLTGKVVGDSLATAGNVTVPGIGMISKKALQALGKVLQGAGQIVHAAGDSAAQKQDQRDRQRALTTGKRAEDVAEHAIDFGTMNEEKKSLSSEVLAGATTIVNSGLGPIDDAKKDLTEKGKGLVEDVTGLDLGTKKSGDAPGPGDEDAHEDASVHEADAHPEVNNEPHEAQDSAEDLAEEHVDEEHVDEEHVAGEDGLAGDEVDEHPEVSNEPHEAQDSRDDSAEDAHEDEAEEDREEDQEAEHEDDGEDDGSGDAEEEEDEDDEDEDDEDESESPAAEVARPEPGPQEDPGGFTYERNYAPLMDRLTTRPTLWQRIKRGASNAWSATKNFFGFGTPDRLEDHIGTPMREKSVTPLLDRMSESQSLGARMGRGVSRAWGSVKSFFGAAPAVEEDDPASHIGDTLRRRQAPPRI